MQYSDGYSKEFKKISLKNFGKYKDHGICPLFDLIDTCIRKVLDQKENKLEIFVKSNFIPIDVIKKLLEAIEENKYIDSIHLYSCVNSDVFVENFLEIGKKLKKIRFVNYPNCTYGEKFSDNLAIYINNNENLEKIHLCKTGTIGKEVCLAINKHKKISTLKLSYENRDLMTKKHFSYILLNSNLRELDISYSYIKSRNIYSGFIEDIGNSNIEKFNMVGNFLDDSKFADKIFDSLRIGNVVKNLSINVHIKKCNPYFSDSLYNFLEKCKSIEVLYINRTKLISELDQIDNFDEYEDTDFSNFDDCLYYFFPFDHHKKTLGILNKRYGITKLSGKGIFTFVKLTEYPIIIKRNRRFWKNGVISLKRKILKTIKKEKIEVPEYYPKLLLKYDRTTLVINFENYMNKNEEKKRKNY